MSGVDLDALLADLDADAPCGPNLEYDPQFLELEQAVLGKPEVQYGDTITPAVLPEWKVVRRLAGELFGRSRDLRVALPLLCAWLALDGVPGLADGLRLIERLLDERWDGVHPQLDPDDDLDPTLRINSLATLADPATILKQVKTATLIALPGLGPLTLRDLEIATGELAPPEGQAKVEVGSIQAAIGDADPERLGALRAALRAAHGSAVNIEAILVRQVGSAQALNLDGLTRALRRARDFFDDAGGADAAAVEADAAPVEQSDEPGAPAPAAARAAPRAIEGEIASRADVLRMLDKIDKYYRQNEPSSPVPMLLARARRLVPKSFMEALEDLAPDGMAQLLVIRGNIEEQAQEE